MLRPPTSPLQVDASVLFFQAHQHVGGKNISIFVSPPADGSGGEDVLMAVGDSGERYHDFASDPAWHPLCTATSVYGTGDTAEAG
jgi:hypothetical protein